MLNWKYTGVCLDTYEYVCTYPILLIKRHTYTHINAVKRIKENKSNFKIIVHCFVIPIRLYDHFFFVLFMYTKAILIDRAADLKEHKQLKKGLKTRRKNHFWCAHEQRRLNVVQSASQLERNNFLFQIAFGKFNQLKFGVPLPKSIIFLALTSSHYILPFLYCTFFQFFKRKIHLEFCAFFPSR